MLSDTFARLAPFVLGRPQAPTRDALCAVRTSGMQGLYVDLPSFGRVPWTDGYVTSPDLTAADRQAVYAAKHAAGDTHQLLVLTWNYNEPAVVFGSLGRAPAGFDGTKDWDRFLAIYDEVLAAGFLVSLHLGGDGESEPQNPDGSWTYNDPVGWTYGWQWLMATIADIRARVGDERAQYTVWCPGFDGCVPAWAGAQNIWQRTNQWLAHARQVLGPTAVLFLYLSAGYWAWSGEHDDYAEGEGQEVDGIYYEGPIPFGPPAPYPGAESGSSWDQLWQVSKRLLRARYRRPADQPAEDDPGTMAGDFLTPRGRMSRVFLEFATYPFVRNQITPEQIAWQRAYIRAVGWEFTG